MSAGRTVENGATWGNFQNRNAAFQARCRCINDNGTAVSICRSFSGNGNCSNHPTVQCGADPAELCSPTTELCASRCMCYPADATVTGNEMTYDQCVAECAGMNMRMPGNQAEVDAVATTGCRTNSLPMWVSVCVVGERMQNNVCVSCDVAEAKSYQNAVAATPQTCGVAKCHNGYDPNADNSACVCEGATKYMNATDDCADCGAGSAVDATDITKCVCSGTGTSWDAASNTCSCATAGQYVNAAGDCADCGAGSAVDATDITKCVCSGTGTSWDAASNTCSCVTAGQYVNAAGDCAACGAGSAVDATDITQCVCSGTGTSWDAASNTCSCATAGQYVNAAGDCAACGAGSAVDATDITQCVCSGTGTSWDAASNTCGSVSSFQPTSDPTFEPTTEPTSTPMVEATPTAAPTSVAPAAPPPPTEFSLTCGPDAVPNTNRTRCCAVTKGVQAYRDDCTVESCSQTHVWREDSSACVVNSPSESNQMTWILAFLAAALLLLSLCAALGSVYGCRQRRTRTNRVCISRPPGVHQETQEQPGPPLQEEPRNYSYQRTPSVLPFSRRQERSRSALASVVFYAPQTSAVSDRQKPLQSQPVATSTYDSAYNPYPTRADDPRRGQQQTPMSQAESLHHLHLNPPSTGSNSRHSVPLDGRYEDLPSAAHLQDLI